MNILSSKPTLPSTATEIQYSPTDQQLHELGVNTELLLKTCDVLKERLASVMQEVNSPEGPCGAPEEMLCTLGSRIREQRKNVGYAIARLEQICKALEI